MEYRDYIWDIETYCNLFSVVIADPKERKRWTFEISDRKDDRKRLFEFLRFIKRNNGRMVGFNSIGFDYPVLHYILKNQDCTVSDIYDKAMGIIYSFDSENKFEHMVPKSKWLIPQLDLFKIHHFDNKAKATSLKMIEFNMRSNDIQDLPYDPSKPLTEKQIDDVLKYNKHDVLQTEYFYKESKGAIDFREKLSKQYGMDFMNHNDTKIGKDYFVMKLEEKMPGVCYKKTRHGQRKIQQTKRDKIDIGNVLFDYHDFSRPEFQAIHKWFKNKTITETKGVFTDLYEYELGDVAQYAEMVTKRKKLKEEPDEQKIEELKKEIPLSWVEERQLKSGKISYYWCWNIATALNVIVNGFRYDYGVGGLHGSVESKIYESNDDMVLVDYDYASMYPNIAIANRVYPEHLSENFCDIYQDVYNQRKQYPKGTPENAVMKLALNGTYGASNDKYSPFYDPQFTMTVTINGQLTLSGLADRLVDVEGLEIVQVNTDGLTVYCRREDQEKVDKIVSDWDAVCGLTMEKVIYKTMAIRDVNNYLAVMEDGKVKRNGAYQYEGLGWHQNQSALVVKMAAEKALLYGGNVEEYILNHEDKMDFMLRAKIPRSSRLVMIDDSGDEIQTQNICRYYISNNGVKLVKVMPPLPSKPESGERYIGIDKEWEVTVCNKMSDFKGDINYDYYIQEARKLVDPLISKTC